ncbi:MAG: UDP-N-acetylmuramoyl-tripeptide--D-alanyl-D-alanine ligase [Polaromonas sp.]|nr:UDP-N-acetylmuramoyl-tripeptide--D-alanyl-D-alanine ligase [Polaromonas sp.]
MMTLQQAQQWVHGARIVGNANAEIKRVHTDTRSLQAGDLFVALKGDNFDAHDFLLQAKAKGAVAVIAQHGLAAAGLPGLEVGDSKLALGQLAKGWRTQFDLPLIAVTGSNGKTTVTQMIASILRAHHADHAFATVGNLNNDIGVPLTLLRLTADYKIGVVELGMNHPGEIAYLADIAKPTVALVNNAQREHLEFMGTVEAVAHENGAVIKALDPQGIAVFPADDEHTKVWLKAVGMRGKLTFATTGKADVTAEARWDADGWQVKALTPQGALEFRLHIAGLHNVKNALAATACALAASVPLTCIAAGLTAFEPVKGRSLAAQVHLQGRSITLIDDTYNANPDSMRAAIDVLAALPGPRLLVMGDMGEVGDQGPQLHEEAGRWAHTQGIENLFALGTQSQLASRSFGSGQHFDDIYALNAAVLAQLPHVGSVLVKGSRFMKMERVVQTITAHALAQTKTLEGNQHVA